MTNPYPAEFRERVLRMLAEARSDHPSDFAAASHVAGRLGVNPETLRFWKKRADVDAGRGPGTTPEAQLEIRRLKTQIAESKKANEILRSASIFLPTELGRPASARAPSDQLTGGETVRVHAENYGICGVDSVSGFSGVSGVRKMHRLLERQGREVGRDQTGCLVRFLESRGVKSGKRVFTMKSDPARARPTDLVQRHLRADTPRTFWVVDVIYVRTWQGAAFALSAFVTDPFSRRIVEFKVASTLNSDILPLQALHTAAFDASGNLTGLTHHSDHGSNSSAMTSPIESRNSAGLSQQERSEISLTTGSLQPSMPHKPQLIRASGPWRTAPQLELATLEWVRWWNKLRLHFRARLPHPDRSPTQVPR